MDQSDMNGKAAEGQVVCAPAQARYRPGMAMRMALGFAAIAIAILAANLITQNSTRNARERMRQLVIEHEPVVHATENLAGAIAIYERAVIDRAERGAVSLAQVEAASQRMAEATAAFTRTARQLSSDEAQVQQLAQDLEAFRSDGAVLVRRSGAQRNRVRDYWSKFRQLESQVSAPQDRATRFAGGVFASESVLALSRSLAAVREHVGATMNPSGSIGLQPVIASEAAFRKTLLTHIGNLTKLEGEPWVAQVNERFRALQAARRAIFDANTDLQQQSVHFRDQGAALSAAVLTQLVEPARSALANADELAAGAAAQADRELTWGSIVVLLLLLGISIITVISVTSPLRALTDATRRLAGGAIRTRVSRGGVREIDILAGAFNQMAQQLEKAETEVRSHQAQLEARVEERTRELQHLANHDPLTQLPNRRQLFAHLDAALERARRSGSRVALLFIDLDNFKMVNDSLGHAFGDRVLQAVGDRLRHNTTFANSFSARLGGDEFTVVFEGLSVIGDAERASAAALEEFQRSLSVHGRELRLSVSVGAGVFPDHADDAQSLLRAADVALFRAKALGRNRGSLFAPELLEAASSRFRTEQALRRAIERGEFDLVYQPQVCFETFTTQTVEALLRWHHPDGQVLVPADFLDVAEQSGLSMEISDWVLQTAIQTAASWYFGPWPQARVAVNISAQQLLAVDFVERLQALLDQYALPAQCLELELTENVLQTGAATIAVLRRLREIGASIALDDFGIGYSSLTSLERLPLTRVKIDRSLIASIDTGTRSPAIVRSIIGLSRSLGLQVTAEGVERLSQLGQLLTDRGIQVQGFLIARPLAVAKIPAFVEASPQHLEELLQSAPAMDQGVETTGSVRALRTATLRQSRAGKGSPENT